MERLALGFLMLFALGVAGIGVYTILFNFGILGLVAAVALVAVAYLVGMLVERVW
jgi:hypothetical protein